MKPTPIILAGGMGTRLKSVLPDVPKPIARLAGRPFLHYLLDRFDAAGFSRVIISVGDRAHLIQEEIGIRYRNLDIQYSCESEPLGTGGAIKLAIQNSDAKEFIVTNGDSFCDVDFNTFVDWVPDPADAAMVLVYAQECNRYGSVETNEHEQVLSFTEKTNSGKSGFINAGIYWFPRSIISRLVAEGHVSLEREVLPKLVGHRLYGMKCEGRFIDIGTPDALSIGQEFFKNFSA